MENREDSKHTPRLPLPGGAQGKTLSPATRAAGVRPEPAPGPDPSHAQDLSTVELVKQITNEVAHLAQKQIELAKTELKADLKAEAVVVGGLGLAALGTLTTVNLLLVTGILALAKRMPGWQAGLLVTGGTLIVTGVVAWVAWSKRVRSPLARTQRTLREDAEWTKGRLA